MVEIVSVSRNEPSMVKECRNMSEPTILAVKTNRQTNTLYIALRKNDSSSHTFPSCRVLFLRFLFLRAFSPRVLPRKTCSKYFFANYIFTFYIVSSCMCMSYIIQIHLRILQFHILLVHLHILLVHYSYICTCCMFKSLSLSLLSLSRSSTVFSS